MDHHHDHGHSHEGSGSGRYWVSAGALMAYSIVEALIGRARSPLILSDAFHNASDGLLTALVGLVKRFTHKSSRHYVWCKLPNLTSFVIYCMTIVTVGLLTLYETVDLRLDGGLPIRPVETGVGTMTLLLTAAVGAFSWGLNWSLGQFMRRGKHVQDRAMANHFVTDAKVSLALVLCAAVSLVIRSPWIVVAGTVYVVGYTSIENIGHARLAYREYRATCDHPSAT